MAIRTITWTVGEDMQVSPTNHQRAGVQGDHLATEAVFKLPASLCEGYELHVEYLSALGEYDKTDALAVVDGKVSFPLPLAWTQEGGKAVLRLVATATQADEENPETVHSFEGKIVFEGRRTAFQKVQSLLGGAIQHIMSVCERAVKRLETADEAAENFMENLPEFEAGKTCYSIYEQQKHVPVGLWVGTTEEYDALPEEPNNTVVIKIDNDELYRLGKKKLLTADAEIFDLLKVGNYAVPTEEVAAALKAKDVWPFDAPGSLIIKRPIQPADSDAEMLLHEAESLDGDRMVRGVYPWGGNSIGLSEWRYQNGVEHGTDGVWTYRKWESGQAELWCVTDVAITSEKKISAYEYATAQVTIDLPFVLTAEPAIVGTATNYFSVCNCATDPGFTKVAFRLKRSTETSESTVTVRIRVDGWWK